MMVYYEDLITNHVSSITSIANFIGASEDSLRSFLKNYDEHRRQSMLYYHKINGGSKSGGDKVDYHKLKMTPEETKGFDEYIKAKEPKLSEKYLVRYFI